MKLRDLFILTGSMAAATQIGAISLGNPQGSVQLGAPIDLVFQVQPDAKQTAESSCLRADVWMGDQALSRSDLQLTPQKNSVRVQSNSPVYEPLVTIKLHGGCTGSISRSYTLFADPPKSLAATVEPLDLRRIQAPVLPPAAATQAPRSSTDKKPQAKPASTSSQNPKKATPATTTKPPKAIAPPAKAAAPSVPPPNSAVSTSAEKPSLRLEPMLFSPTEGLESARLRVEPLDGLDLLEPADSTPAASDTLSQPATNINAERLEGLEKQLQSLQAQLLSNRAEITNLQTQLAQAQNQELPIWVYAILALLAAALAAIAWLLQRIKRERKNAQDAWADAVLAVHEVPPSTPPEPRPPAAKHTAPESTSAPLNLGDQETSSPLAPTSAIETRTASLSADDLYAEFDQLSTAPAAVDTPASPPVSLTEVLSNHALFDVQEQAEFYASIGENEQAIEILQTHIAAHQNSSPLAYIELLQLLYRLSRTDSFEQVREQFQSHFNVQVPSFLGFARKGSDLWSGYPDILSKIEALWPTDEIQSLLHHLIVRQPGNAHADSTTRFDLAAFDDLLMLYNVVQTTPATSRGELPGRTRTSPTDIPLPDVFLAPEEASSHPSNFGMDNALGNFTATQPLPLHEAHLDVLSTAPLDAPLPSLAPRSDSPFQSPTHFAPNEVLMDGLSLEWEDTNSPAAAPSTQPDPIYLELHSLEKELGNYMMDERDLPAPRKPRQP